MLDPRTIAADPAATRQNLARRHVAAAVLDAVDAVADASKSRAALVTERDGLLAQRNTLSREIGGLMKAGNRDAAEAIKARVGEGNARVAQIEVELAEVELRQRDLVLQIPNALHADVPDGSSEHDNVVVRTWGEPRGFAFTPLAHVEVGEKLGIIDLERAAKLSGTRFSVLKGAGARLERALIQWFLDVHTEEHGYTEVMVPYIVHDTAMFGTGQLPKFRDDMFELVGELNGRAAYLIPTAEVPVTNLHRDEILDESQLPLKYAAFTPCFRAEAGSAGRDVRGLIRVHQFHKVELVWITTPEQAEASHQALVGHAEVLLQRLGLPYRTMLLCGGDIGFNAHKCYDLEVWLPSQATYREISSCSQFGDFQARRLQLRYRPAGEDAKKAKTRLCATLNGSGLAVGRTLVAILENYQQADGTVLIPEVLRPYMGGADRIG